MRTIGLITVQFDTIDARTERNYIRLTLVLPVLEVVSFHLRNHGMTSAALFASLL